MISFRELGQLPGLEYGQWEEKLKRLPKEVENLPWPEHSHLQGSWVVLKFNACSHVVESKVVINADLGSRDYTRAEFQTQ